MFELTVTIFFFIKQCRAKQSLAVCVVVGVVVFLS